MDKQLRIVFMGTPDFAANVLQRLADEKFNIVGVVTMPDKPVGRHQNELQASPVKQRALSCGLPLLQPERLKDELFLQQLRDLHADLQVVVAFRMLPEAVWNMPRLGTFNLHASLLPQYRGAAPINWAIINGETETGNTTFFLQHEIDTGNIIQQCRIPIEESDNAGTLHDKLMILGAQMTVETIHAIERGSLTTTPQTELAKDAPLHPAPKIFKETCQIRWDKPLKQIYDFIRGLSPYPAAWTWMVNAQGERTAVKIFETRKELSMNRLPLGEVETDGKSYLRVYVEGGFLYICSLQAAGKRRMNIREFLCGIKEAEMLKFKFYLEG